MTVLQGVTSGEPRDDGPTVNDALVSARPVVNGHAPAPVGVSAGVRPKPAHVGRKA